LHSWAKKEHGWPLWLVSQTTANSIRTFVQSGCAVHYSQTRNVSHELLDKIANCLQSLQIACKVCKLIKANVNYNVTTECRNIVVKGTSGLTVTQVYINHLYFTSIAHQISRIHPTAYCSNALEFISKGS
jgi:hypothetical protein